MFKDPSEFENIPSENPIELIDLKILKITLGELPAKPDHKYPLINGTFSPAPPRDRSKLPQYGINAPHLEELINSGISMDYRDLTQRFPQLQKLVVHSRSERDVLLTDNMSLASLHTLELHGMSEFGHQALIHSLRRSPVETLVMNDYMAAPRGHVTPPPLNLLNDIDGTTIFKDTLRSCTVSFRKQTKQSVRMATLSVGYPNEYSVRLEFRELPLLDHLVIFGSVKSILIDNCPSLEGVHIGDPDLEDGADFSRRMAPWCWRCFSF